MLISDFIFREFLVVMLANDLSASLLYKITHHCNPVGSFTKYSAIIRNPSYLPPSQAGDGETSPCWDTAPSDLLEQAVRVDCVLKIYFSLGKTTGLEPKP